MTMIVDYRTQEQAMQTYFREGERRAMTLGNRGLVRYADDGLLHPNILAAYKRCGFYVFEGVIQAEELAELEAAFTTRSTGCRLHQGRPLMRMAGRPSAQTSRPLLSCGKAACGSLWRHRYERGPVSGKDV